ncbi:MAG TPA: hypothetical protein VEM15_09390 [Thermodesulfobacteriota bacterium]|nr:hypothetical protein [Thermodesulfobacteriota bacterium]
MEIQKNKKEKIILWIYAILMLIYAPFDIVVNILPKLLKISLIPNAAFLNHYFTLTGISLYLTPINIIVGYGLLRRRYWARYAVIAVMLTFPVLVFAQFLRWGVHSLNNYAIVVQFLFVVLTLLYFSRRPVNAAFGQVHPFRFISWHGVLVIVILLLSSWSIMFLLYWKVHVTWKFGYPFFTEKPQIVTLKRPQSPETLPKYREARLLNISLLIPKEFSIRRFKKIEGETPTWGVSLQNRGANTKGFILFGNGFAYGEFFPVEEIANMLGHISKFDMEKYILTNDWNPGLVAIRPLMRPKGAEGFNIKEIHIDGLKGFLKGWQRGDGIFREFSLYNREDTQYIGGTIMSTKGYLDEIDILTIVSSIEFPKPEDPAQAGKHYEKGLRLYQSGDILQAQIEFANAYYLSPENPDYIFMLAKSLYLKDQELLDYTHIKGLLNKALKLKPGYKEAQRLLKEIEPKVPKAKN